MKRILSVFCLAIIMQVSFAQEEKVTSSSITRVTVFSQGAQIEQEATVALQKGPMILKFTGLSPYINKESIRIKGDASFTILNVQHQNDFVNELERNQEIESLNSRLKDLQFKAEDEETFIKILTDKLDFLSANKEITGGEKSIDPQTFNSLNEIYGSNIQILNLEILKRQRLIRGYQEEMDNITNQSSSLHNRSDLPSGTIIVTIDSKMNLNSEIFFSYTVANASWYPSYDIRFSGIDKPLAVTYKANIIQNTGVDWKDIDIVLSTAKTDISAQIPEFTPFYLQFYYPEITSALQGRVAGVQVQDNLAEMPSESEMRIRGFGSIADAAPMYIVDGVPMSDISLLDPNNVDKIEVLKDASAAGIYGSRAANGVVLITTKSSGEGSSVPFVITTKRETSNEYFVDAPQTILSNSKTTSVNYRETVLDADFEYQAIPILSENVYLIGNVADWYKAELLDGEMNVYLENSYVGKSLINTQLFNDTLELSFGNDNNISIKRERVSEFTEDQFIGANRKETVGYKISVRNNKSYAVNVSLTDQVPVSSTKEIQVEVLEISGAKMDAGTGKLEWKVPLQPDETKEFTIRYSVRYPKDKRVMLE